MMATLRPGLSAVLLSLALLVPGSRLHAQGAARFDLPGPRIDIRVTRNGSTLPIASVPNLQAGDQIWLHPDLPPSQSVKYLLIAAFLRGTTNPPPDDWFTRIETWQKNVREEGVTITVPAEAQQAILFLAPETGGDFPTLRSAVKGRPGVFVRASQDLTEAGFEQSRIEKYLAAMKQVPPGDAKALQEHSDLLARTLALKPNPDCFKHPLDQQYTCLTQTGTQTLLDDGHAQSIVAALSNGPGSDFISAASYTNLAGGGAYSAYVGAIVDLVRLTSGLHTAKYQYIPAIAFPATDDPTATAKPADATSDTLAALDLRLNTPPSFNNPKSVIVIGLPTIQRTIPPPLRPVDVKHISCLLDPHLALPIEGAPLVFSTAYAHDLVLHLDTPGAARQDIPLMADAYQGGLVFKPTGIDVRKELPSAAPRLPKAVPRLGSSKGSPKPESRPADAGSVAPAASVPIGLITGTVEGFWGFDHFNGPTLPLQQIPGTGWRILSTSANSPGLPADTLIVGHPNHLQLMASATACVQSISLEPGDTHIDWKLAEAKPAEPHPAAATVPPSAASSTVKPPPPQPVDLTLNLAHDAAPGSVHLAIEQFGAPTPALIGTTTFVEPARIESLQLHASDTSALLTGAGLDQVRTVTLGDSTYLPSGSARDSGKALSLSLADASRPENAKATGLKAEERVAAEVHLRDGRNLPVSTVVLPARPAVTILSRHVNPPQNAPAPSIALAAGDDLALGSQITFFLKSKAAFLRNDKIEIANDSPSDQPLDTTLTVAAGTLVLQDAHTILASFDPLKTFGPSTFGPFRLRPVAADGTAGDWVPFATIVRLPALSSLTCPADPAATCSLAGSGLYLIDSISYDPAFTSPTQVPEGFVDASVPIPHPAPNTQPVTFYVRLRDDPARNQQVTLNVQTDTPTPPPARGHHSNAGIPAAAPTPAVIPAPALPATANGTTPPK